MLIHHSDLEKRGSDTSGPASEAIGHPDSHPDAHLSEEEKQRIERDLIWRLDVKLIPWLCLLYLVSFIDRANIGNAKIDGLIDDLHMSQMEYNNTLTIFFVSYAVFEPASNILLKRLRPGIYIPVLIVAWGLIMTCMGFVESYAGLMVCRWFLGLAEAGLFPGVNYYLSCWYKRREFGIRAAVFFSAAAVSGSFGGLLAAGISQMRGLRGRPGWAWIFILEGAMTIATGLASFWMVHDFPDTATFLSDADRQRLLHRLHADNQASANHEAFRTVYLWQSVEDWKTYVGAFIYMGVVGTLYAFSLFLPSIIKELGFSATKAQLLTVPPYAVACVLTIVVGWYSDKHNQRGIYNICVSVIGVVGFAILLGSTSPTLSYVATFLGALGIYPCIPTTITWVSNNVEGVYKRGVTLGIVIGWGNLNGVVASNIYRAQDAPHYRLGHAVCLGYLAIALLGGSVLNYVLLRQENTRRRAGKRDGWIEGKSKEEVEKLGDMRPDFLYTL